eukprot:scaffold7529_cov143-Isochrysis_galbana.AAC.7
MVRWPTDRESAHPAEWACSFVPLQGATLKLEGPPICTTTSASKPSFVRSFWNLKSSVHARALEREIFAPAGDRVGGEPLARGCCGRDVEEKERD